MLEPSHQTFSSNEFPAIWVRCLRVHRGAVHRVHRRLVHVFMSLTDHVYVFADDWFILGPYARRLFLVILLSRSALTALPAVSLPLLSWGRNG